MNCMPLSVAVGGMHGPPGRRSHVRRWTTQAVRQTDVMAVRCTGACQAFCTEDSAGHPDPAIEPFLIARVRFRHDTVST